MTNLSRFGRWLLIGGAGLLPAALLFSSLRSAGVLYARPLAWLLLSVGSWWLGWSGIVPYGLSALVGVLLLLWSVSVVLALRRPELLRALTRRMPIAVFLGSMVGGRSSGSVIWIPLG